MRIQRLRKNWDITDRVGTDDTAMRAYHAIVMVEIVITIEESLELSLPNEELQALKTVEDVQHKITSMTQATV